MTTIAYDIQWDRGTGFEALPGALGAEITLEATDGVSGLGWGASAVPRCTVRATAATYDALSWEYATLRVRISIDGGDLEDAYAGPILRRSDDGVGLTYEGGGWDAVIERAPVRMPLRERRPVATATAGVAASAEDPATGEPGLINEVLWRCGGRPEHLSGTYPSATFYYACEASAFAPAYAAVDTDNPWQELLELATAGGGQIYQDASGTLRYVNPLRLAVASETYPQITAADYRRLTVDEPLTGAITAALAPYQRRTEQADQVIYEDTTPRSLEPSGEIEETVALRSWAKSVRAIVVAASYADGSEGDPATAGIGTVSAQRADINVINPSATARLLVERITLYGTPVQVTGEGVSRVAGPAFGRYTSELNLPSNRYIQEADDAERWARMAQIYAGRYRPVYRASGVIYDPRILPGAFVELVKPARRGGGAVGCRVIRVQISRSGTSLDFDAVPVGDLPVITDYFVIGEAYGDSDQRRFGF